MAGLAGSTSGQDQALATNQVKAQSRTRTRAHARASDVGSGNKRPFPVAAQSRTQRLKPALRLFRLLFHRFVMWRYIGVGEAAPVLPALLQLCAGFC